MMKSTLVGVIKVDPKQLLEDGIRRELVNKVAGAFNSYLVFEPTKVRPMGSMRPARPRLAPPYRLRLTRWAARLGQACGAARAPSRAGGQDAGLPALLRIRAGRAWLHACSAPAAGALIAPVRGQDYVDLAGLKIWQEEVRHLVWRLWQRGGAPNPLFPSLALSCTRSRALSTTMWSRSATRFCAPRYVLACPQALPVFPDCNGWLWCLAVVQVLDSQSLYQSRAIPIPRFRPTDAQSVNFIGRLARELLRLTSPQATTYLEHARAWYDLKTRTEVINKDSFSLLQVPPRGAAHATGIPTFRR
jgi:hypothetical protein